MSVHSQSSYATFKVSAQGTGYDQVLRAICFFTFSILGVSSYFCHWCYRPFTVFAFQNRSFCLFAIPILSYWWVYSNCLPCRFVSSSLTDCDNNSCWLTSYAADRNMVLRKRRHKGLSFLWNLTHRQEGQRQKQRQRSSLLFGGQNWFNSLPH